MRGTGCGVDDFLGCCMVDCQRLSFWSFGTDLLMGSFFFFLSHDMFLPPALRSHPISFRFFMPSMYSLAISTKLYMYAENYIPYCATAC